MMRRAGRSRFVRSAAGAAGVLMLASICAATSNDGDTPGQRHGATVREVAVQQPETSQRPYEVAVLEAPDPQSGGRWGERTAVAGDVDGDGVSDFFVGDPNLDAGDQENAGRVYLISGRDRSVLYRIDSPQQQANAKFGFAVTVLGDISDDGTSDLVVGTDSQDVGSHIDQGKAWVFSGADGAMLYALDNPFPQGSPDNEARFGSRTGLAGDVTGDGAPDAIVGASANDVPAGCGDQTPAPQGCHENQGQAFIFDGATGGLVRTLDLPLPDQPLCSASCSFGLSVQGPGDTDGDGVPDQLVDAGGYQGAQGRMYVFSGRTGEVLQTVDDPAPQPGAFFGFQDVAPLTPGDLDGDGRADLYGNGFLQNGPAGPGQGRAWVFDGTTGTVLDELIDPTPTQGGQFAFSATRTDYNADGTPDVYVGQTPHMLPVREDDNGGSYIYDGRTRALLKALELPASMRQQGSPDNIGPNLGWTTAAPGDLNGDGQPDYIAGAPFTDVGQNKDQGRLVIFLSRR